MKTLQEAFGLAVPADSIRPTSNHEGTKGTIHNWTVDSRRFPEIVQFFLDDVAPPCDARAVGSKKGRYGESLFRLDSQDRRTADFGGTLLELCARLPIDAILVVDFEEPPVTVEMRMPQAPWKPLEDPRLNTSVNGHISVIHTAGSPPAWLALETPQPA